MKEYTAKVSFYINVMASDKKIARISLLNQLQFPGHVIADLNIKIKDLPEDMIKECDECKYVVCVCKPVVNKDLPDDK